MIYDSRNYDRPHSTYDDRYEEDFTLTQMIVIFVACAPLLLVMFIWYRLVDGVRHVLASRKS